MQACFFFFFPIPIRKAPRMKATENIRANGNPQMAALPSHLDPDTPGPGDAAGARVCTSSFSPAASILFLISTQVRFVQLANKVF